MCARNRSRFPLSRGSFARRPMVLWLLASSSLLILTLAACGTEVEEDAPLTPTATPMTPTATPVTPTASLTPDPTPAFYRAGLLYQMAGTGFAPYLLEDGPAKDTAIGPSGLAVDRAGNVIFADLPHNLVRKLSPDGQITTLAGNGEGIDVRTSIYGSYPCDLCGDGGPATDALLSGPTGMTLDREGSVYFVDSLHGEIRKVTLDGTISRVAGGGEASIKWNPIATDAMLDLPAGVAFDAAGNLYITIFGTGWGGLAHVDSSGNLILDTAYEGGVSCRNFIAGTRLEDYDGAGLAGLVIDDQDNLYFSEYYCSAVYKVSPEKIMTRVAGNGYYGFSGDGGPATEAELSGPLGIDLDSKGNLYIADTYNHRVRRVDPNGTISTVVGNGELGTGEDGPALEVGLEPVYVHIDAQDRLVISDAGNFRLRRLDKAGALSTLAGTGELYRLEGDALDSSGWGPLLSDGGGGVFMLDGDNARIRHLSRDRTFTTVAGAGIGGYGGVGGDARIAHIELTEADLEVAFVGWIGGMVWDGLGNLCFSTLSRIQCIDPGGTLFDLVGGTGPSPLEDLEPATDSRLGYPGQLAIDGNGNLYVSESQKHVIRRIDPEGNIQIFAGGLETTGFSGDGGPATEALLNKPYDLAVDSGGNVLIADARNNRVRRVDPQGIISTYAGNGEQGNAGDGLPATQAQLYWPCWLALDEEGNLYVSSADRVRAVRKDGIMVTVAGGGTADPSPQGVQPTSVQLSGFGDMVVTPGGDLFLQESSVLMLAGPIDLSL